jgi:uncharacterized membrane protein (UPF0127 family)
MPHIVEILLNKQPLINPIHTLYCDTFLCRLRGLMFRNEIAEDEGLLLVQKNNSRTDSSIHMLFVGMDLGVVWLDANFSVVDMVIAKSWKPAYFPTHPAKYTLEIHPDRIPEFKLGDKVSFYEI